MRTANNQGLHIGFRNTDSFTFAFYGNDLDVSGLSDLSWHHWACVYESGAVGSNRHIYRDGTLVGSDLSSSDFLGSGTLYIGASSFGGVSALAQMDEVRFWNRALCQDELQAHMNCELAGTESGLIAYYEFNQGISGADNTAVTTLTDSGPNALNGTLNNFTLNGPGSNWVEPGGVASGVSCAPFLASEIDLKGNSISIVKGDSTPSATDGTDFGNTIVPGGMITHTFTITNSGSGTLTISDISPSGAAAADFIVSGISLPYDIDANDSTTFNITFIPSAIGLRQATIVVSNNDCDEARYDFVVQGTGVVNQPPMVASDNSAVTVGEGAIAANIGTFSDPDGNGTITITASIGIITPNNNAGTWSWSFHSTDGPDESQTVTITATDGFNTNTASFTLSVTNIAPAAVGQTLTIEQDTPTNIVLTATDPGNDTITNWTITLSPTNGAVTGTPPNVTYTPASGFYGSDSFGFNATDSDGAASAEATVSIVVKPVPPLLLLPEYDLDHGSFSFTVDGPLGRDYIIQAATLGFAGFSGWTNLATNVTPSTPFHFNDHRAGDFTNRLYRIRLAP